MAEHYKSFQKNSIDCTFQDPKFLVHIGGLLEDLHNPSCYFPVATPGDYPRQNCRRLERKRNLDKNQIELLQSSSA